MDKACEICGGRTWSVLYQGPIRVGSFGHYSPSPATVWKCNSCQSGFLDVEAIDYTSTDYRQLVDGDASPVHYYRAHDGEQLRNITVLGTDQIRGKVIADVGCGAGSFLDLVRGFADTTIAIEPAEGYHEALTGKGHRVYSYCTDALSNWEGKVDIVVSFAVLEHVPHPLDLLCEMKRLLKPGGFALVSTPNYDDWMIDFLPREYGKFFFRRVHTWYFNGTSLVNLGRQAGFPNAHITYVQRFDLSNALMWIRDNKPNGLGRFPLFSDVDSTYMKDLEKKGKSDFIYAMFTMD